MPKEKLIKIALTKQELAAVRQAIEGSTMLGKNSVEITILRIKLGLEIDEKQKEIFKQ